MIVLGPDFNQLPFRQRGINGFLGTDPCVLLVGFKGHDLGLGDEGVNDYLERLPVEWKPAQMETRAQKSFRAFDVKHLAVGRDAQRNLVGNAGSDSIYEIQPRVPNLIGRIQMVTLARVARRENQPRVVPLHEQVEHQVKPLLHFVDVGQIDDVNRDRHGNGLAVLKRRADQLVLRPKGKRHFGAGAGHPASEHQAQRRADGYQRFKRRSQILK